MDEAALRRITIAVAAALEQLVAAVGFPLPADVLERLRAAPKGRLEAVVHRSLVRPFGAGSALPAAVDHYLRARRLDPSLAGTRFLQASLGVSTRRALATRLARKAAEAAVPQAALRLAPSAVRSCTRCGRRHVQLRPRADQLCPHCAATASA